MSTLLESEHNRYNNDINDDDDDEDLLGTHFDLPPQEPLTIKSFFKNLSNLNINYCWVKACLILIGLILGLWIGITIAIHKDQLKSTFMNIDTNNTSIDIINTIIPTISKNINDKPTDKPTPFIRPTSQMPTTSTTHFVEIAPSAEANIEAPSAEANIEAPSAEANIEAPSAEANIEAPSAGANIEAPSAEANIEAPSAETNTIPTPMPIIMIKPKTVNTGKNDEDEVEKDGRLTTTFTKLGTNINDDMLKDLEIGFTLDVRHETENKFHDYGIYYGSYKFNVKYPNDGQNYEDSFIRKWCWNINFKKNANFDINNIDISIEFIKFDVEIGFDKIVIRNYNSSVVDLPVPYAGQGNNGTIDILKYYIEKGQSKNLCVEFMADDSIGLKGIEYNMVIKYDPCKWNNWDKCFKINLIGVRWGRGPFSNGKCGVGITKQTRTKDVLNNKYNGNGIAKCEEVTKGPEYCTKAPCENWNNWEDPDYPPKPGPGWAWFNVSRYYNGRGRLDPIYPDIFKMYLSQNDASNINLDKLKSALETKIKEIVSEHQKKTGENILIYALQGGKERELFKSQLGARVLDSLLIGRPFVWIGTGDSVCSGHDNQLVSTYSYQLQTRLRKFWIENGVKGSAFTVRNIGEGGGMDQWTQSYAPYSMGTENWDFFSNLNTETDTNIIKEADIVSWEAVFTEGASRISQRETHLRSSLLINALWGRIFPIGGVKQAEGCQTTDALERKRETYAKGGSWDKNLRFHDFVPKYDDKVGIHLIDTQMGMMMACPVLSTKANITHTKWGDDGEPPDGMGYGYSSYYLKANWHPNPRGHRIMSDFYSYWILKSGILFIDNNRDKLNELIKDKNKLKEYLRNQSGRYSDKIINGIKNNNEEAFIKPVLCGKDGDGWCNTIPYPLTGLQPDLWNIHYRLKDYIINTNMNDLKKINWVYQRGDNQIGFHLKTGGPYAMDEKWFFKPDKAYHSKIFKDNGNDVKKTIAKLIDQGTYIQFSIKTPKYGDGIVQVMPGYRCKKEDMSVLGYYISKIDDNNIGNVLNKPLNDVDNCQWTGLQKNTKYKVTVVGISGEGSFSFLFGK